MVLDHVTIIPVLNWDIRPSSLILVVGLMDRWEWWFPRVSSIDGILWVRISHSVMSFIVCFIRSMLRVLIGYVQRLWVLRCVVRYIVVLGILVTHGCL